MRIRHAVVALFCLLVCTVAVLADTLTLKDGTVLQGKVIQQGENYWIKLSSGESRVVMKGDVVSFVKGDAAAKPATPGIKAPPAAPQVPVAAPPPGAQVAPANVSAAFLGVKSKADRKETPVEALQLWDQFLDKEPNAVDKAAAEKEQAFWNQLQKTGSERINGKWIGGKELKDLKKKVEELTKEGDQLLVKGQTIEGTKKMEEAIKLYPKSFEANFYLGLHYLNKGAVGSNGQGNNAYMAKAIQALETAAKLAPTSAATWSNLAVGYNFKKQYQKSVEVAYHAVKLRETKETVQNLIAALSFAPPGMRDNNRVVKPIMEDAVQVAQKHGVQIGSGAHFVYIRPDENNTRDEDPEAKAPPGAAWSGSGFFVTSDGYIITNHHVATGDPKKPIDKEISFRVRMDDGSEKAAQLIAIDEAADIALMKIKLDKPVEFLKIADGNPGQGAKALVLGYPATGEDRPTMQISEGAVKSIHEDGEYNVWFDLNTTHGNSGGPIVDKGGRVIGILTAGWKSYDMVMIGGVGPMQIKTFLEKIGDKAPKVEYTSPIADAVFDAEGLTERCRKSTLFILAIRGDKQEGGGSSSSGGDDKSGGDGDGDGSGSGGAGAGGAGTGGAKPQTPAP